MANVFEKTEVELAIDSLVEKGLVALEEFRQLNQEQVDYIVAKCSIAALDKHGLLAKAAIDETKRGVFEDKATKNLFACEYVVNNMKHLKTVGVISEDSVTGITEIADPVGVICGITPVTNPTSTVIFKVLISLKTRNPIIFAFHPSAQQSSKMAAQILKDAAIAAGAPENCVQWIDKPSMEATSALMKHPGIATILATGGNSLVKAAYSCGKPALGVGAGNVPAFIADDADIKQAVNDIVISKAFDNGMVCASEQAVIINKAVYNKTLDLFKKYKVYIASEEEKKLLELYMFGKEAYSKDVESGSLNPIVVGKPAHWIAKQAGFDIPEDTSIILAEIKKVGYEEPLSREKLSPVLAVLKAKDNEEGIKFSQEMVELNGLGHSAGIHTKNEGLVKEFGLACKACRIIWNSPTTFGGIGAIYNSFIPSMTLGCGSYGRNSVSGNVSAINLVNVKKIGKRRNNMQWFKIPQKIYFERNSIQYLQQCPYLNRVMIVTDNSMVELGFLNKIEEQLNLRRNSVVVQLFSNVETDPDITTVKKGAEVMRNFKPDTIIALGGGSVMDAAKVMWLFYEHPEVNFDDLKQKFMDIRKRAFKYPELGKEVKLICIPTTSGTGSEVTPFSVISDKANNKKYPLTDYSLTPTIAIIDPEFTTNLPSVITAHTGMDVLTHAVEAYVSVLASDFTDGLAIQAIKLVFENLERAVVNGKNDLEAREKMHNASTIAGMAFANAFLGASHSMAHKIGGLWHVPHGLANAILLPYVIRYNGETNPGKLSTWPKYNVYNAAEKYQAICDYIGLKTKNVEEAPKVLAAAVRDLSIKCGITPNFEHFIKDEKAWNDSLETLAYDAYEDQCTPANPRVPMVQDMIEIMKKAYKGIE